MCLRLFRRKKVNTAKIVPISKNPLFLKSMDKWYEKLSPEMKECIDALYSIDLD